MCGKRGSTEGGKSYINMIFLLNFIRHANVKSSNPLFLFNSVTRFSFETLEQCKDTHNMQRAQ